MLAYVIADSHVESRILINLLNKQGVEASHIRSPNGMKSEAKENRDTLIFIDWDNPTLNTAQKTALAWIPMLVF